VTALVAVGTLTAAFLAHGLATRPVRAEARGHTMAYVFGLPRAELLVAGYLIATVGALLLSGEPLAHRARSPGRGGRPGVLAAVAAGVRVDLVRTGGGLLAGPVRMGEPASRPEVGSPGGHLPFIAVPLWPSAVRRKPGSSTAARTRSER
jgi:hypothetical protein